MRWILYFSLFSIIGYIIEVVLCSITQRRMANRGFLFGPYLPIYGFGGILIMLTTTETRDNFALTFLISMAVCSALEYMTSLIMEKLFNVRWWDYKGERFNLHGRICMRNSLAFGIGGCILIYSALPVVDNIIDILSNTWQTILAVVMMVIFGLDTLISSYANSKVKYLADLNKTVGDQTREIKKAANRAIAQIFKRR